jgi:hypothetical protein
MHSRGAGIGKPVKPNWFFSLIGHLLAFAFQITVKKENELQAFLRKIFLTPLHNKQLAAKTDEGNHSSFDALG